MRLFPKRDGEVRWQQFAADGFESPVCGIVFEPGEASCGIPLGGLGTGCMDLDTDGTFGRCSIFNSFVPHRDIRSPLLWIERDGRQWIVGKNATDIEYFGHYPIADLEVRCDADTTVGMRAWCPFILGQAEVSNSPGAIFEVRVRNLGDQTARFNVGFGFDGPSESEATAPFERDALTGSIQGHHFRSSEGVGYVLGTVGSECSATNAPWQQPDDDAATACQAVVDVPPKEERILRFVLAWYAPRWKGNDEHDYWHKYRDRFSSAVEVADFLAANHEQLLATILRQQQLVYDQDDLPMWLRDQMVNIMHTIAEDSFWAANSIPPEDWCGSTGIFGLTESPRTAPHVALPSDYYGALPLIFFFPEQYRAVLRAYTHFQLPNGEIALGIGSGADLLSPIYHCLHTVNASNFVELIHRLWSATGSEGLLREFYPAVKLAIEYTKSLDRDGDGLPDLDPDPCGNQFYGAWLWYGTATHPNGYWLAALASAQKMAAAMGDRALVNDCQVWMAHAGRSLEEKLWNGDNYLLYHDTSTEQKSDTILANQLAGHWQARMNGVAPFFPAPRVATVLETVKQNNLPATEFGALNAVRPDGSLDESGPRHSNEIFPAENLIVAATLAYEGDLDGCKQLAAEVMQNIVLRQKAMWDMPNIVEPVDGKITHGTDFYQMMVIWALPMALRGQSIQEFCADGGFVSELASVSSRACPQTRTSR